MSHATLQFQITGKNPLLVGEARLFAIDGAMGLGESELPALLRAVSEDRREKASRFLKFDDMKRSLLGEILVRYAFEQVGLEEEVSFPWQRGQYGKPFFENLGVCFNLSHSGDWVVCAVSGSEIGLDVERHHDLDMGIAERYFTPQETRHVRALGQKAFFDIWSAKESYLKAIGLGLSGSLDSFSCIPDPSGLAYHPSRQDDTLPLATIRSLLLGPGYSASVCLLGDSLHISVTCLKAQEFVQRLSTLSSTQKVIL